MRFLNLAPPSASSVSVSPKKESLSSFSGTEKNFLPLEHLNIENKSVLTMLDYLKNHYTEDISIQNLADLTSITPNYASQLFKEETGYTFSSYLTSLRIYQATLLLQTTDLPIFLVASEVGYKDYFYFAKVFKKITGYTPSTYRSALDNGERKEKSDETC